MSASRLWILVIALASVVVLVLGWVVGVKPQLDAVVAAEQLRLQVEQENVQHAADLAELKLQFADIDELRDELEGLREAVPEGWDQASVVRTVRETAETGGLAVESIEWSDAVFYAPAASGGAAIPPPEETADPPIEEENQADPAIPPLADATTGVVLVDPADASALTNTLVAVPVKINIYGGYAEILSFASRLRDSERLLLVTGITYTGGSGGVSSITGLVYVLPGPTG
ncbi:hypothetical protein BH10ACT7_BH10ACT7_13920 [soil metagenome]